MARVTHFENGTQNVSVHDTEVACYFQSIKSGEGSTLVHLSTFGSENRQSKPKSSQSIQLDRAAARELITVLEGVFPGLVASGTAWVG